MIKIAQTEKIIYLPKKFKTNIINLYGNEGEIWVKGIDNLIEKYINKYKIENIELVDNLSINLVLKAKSQQYGNIILKIAPATRTLISEASALEYYSSKYSAMCYYYDEEDETMILELLSPGINLFDLDNQEERIKVFSNIANNIMFNPENNENFKIFEKRFYDKIMCVEENKEEFLDIKEIIDMSIQVYNTIKSKNLPKYVLHGDLQHKNILKSEDNWKVIDPHGIVAERAFETSIFILSEFIHNNMKVSELNNLISSVSKYFLENEEILKNALFVTLVEKIIWLRHSRYDEQIVPTYINICNYLCADINVRQILIWK